MRVLDLFSGIGGFSLGLERAGMRTVAFCEIEPYCRAVLRKHWPNVPCYSDVRELSGSKLWDDGNTISIQVICGGFPCQDASIANTSGNRPGIDGDRTGLWVQIARLASDLLPKYIILENVPGLLSAGFGRVLGDLAALGYDAEWRCIPALTAGLPHRRDRLWVVAYPSRSRLSRSFKGQSILESAEAALPFIGHEAARAWRSLDGDFDSLRAGDGVSVAMERRRIQPLGNSIIPQMSQAIGEAIMQREGLST